MTSSNDRKKALIVLIVTLAAMPLGYFGWRLARESAGRRIPVTSEISIELVTLLYEKSAAYPSPSKWKEVVANNLPSFISAKLPRAWLNHEPIYRWNLKEDRVLLLMKLSYPSDWKSGIATHHLTRRLEDILHRAGIEEVYLQYPDGYRSAQQPIYVTHVPKWGANGTTVLEGLAFQVPPNHDSFTVHFAGTRSDDYAEDQKLSPLKLHSPMYRSTSVVGYAKPLPQSLTIDGVTVTLNSVVTKARFPSGLIATKSSTDNSGVKYYQPEKAAGSTADPYYAIAGFSIADSGSTLSQWAITEPVKVSYGSTPETPFESTTQIHQADREQVVVFNTDFGVLAQPVKINTSLIRKDKFPADEHANIIISLPSAGQYTDPGRVVAMYDGDITAFVGHKVSFTDLRSTRPGELLSLLISADKVLKRDVKTQLTHLDLVTTSGKQINLLPYIQTESAVSHWHTLEYNLERACRDASITDADLGDSALRLTLIRPRKFPHQFEFIAKPTEPTREPAHALRAAGADNR